MTQTAPNILEVLQLSYVQYDNYRERQYQTYCNKIAEHFFMSYKQLHSHDLMQNYFHDMWNLHVEKAFLRDNAVYFPLCEVQLLRNLFEEYTRNIIDKNEVQMYPLPLIKAIRKKNLKKIAN